MISLLAPSKTMNLTSHKMVVPTSKPQFLSEAAEIVNVVQSLDDSDLAKLMKVSMAISQATHGKYQQWGKVTQPAVYVYRGDVYKGFYSDTLSQDDLVWANEHIMILSGLYGLLRLSDEVSAYRLEMGLKLPIGTAKNLYEFWGNRLAEWIETQADGVVCILSSQEYAKPVTAHIKRSELVMPVFTDNKPNGKVGTVPIYSKMMRGVMARWIIDHRVNTPEGLRDFTGHGYAFDTIHSTRLRPVFHRNEMKPLQFNSPSMV
ncbi:MAG: YaaA family protein [Candidatus Saccharibacteria bacterium]